MQKQREVSTTLPQLTGEKLMEYLSNPKQCQQCRKWNSPGNQNYGYVRFIINMNINKHLYQET